MKWRRVAESQIVSEKISEGGNFSFFSFFCGILLKTEGLRVEDVVLVVKLLIKGWQLHAFSP